MKGKKKVKIKNKKSEIKEELKDCWTLFKTNERIN